MRVAAVLLLVRGATAANGTRVRGHGFSFDATAVLERRALPVNASWRIHLHARARLKRRGKELRASNAHISQLQQTAQELSNALAAAPGLVLPSPSLATAAM